MHIYSLSPSVLHVHASCNGALSSLGKEEEEDVKPQAKKNPGSRTTADAKGYMRLFTILRILLFLGTKSKSWIPRLICSPSDIVFRS
jgi:hypothetical protein